MSSSRFLHGLCWTIFLITMCCGIVFGQEKPGEKAPNQMPVATQWLLVLFQLDGTN